MPHPEVEVHDSQTRMQALLRLSRNTKQDMGLARKMLTAAQEDLRDMQASAGVAEGSAPGFLPKINSHR